MSFNKEELERSLNIKIQDPELFKCAFTHRSYLNENPGYDNPSNERLEFLGDAVLQLLSSEFLYHNYPEKQEGVMTNLRASLVNTISLAKEAKRLEYGQHLLLSNGEDASGGRDKEYILANTFEAVLGALYLENGLSLCKTFLEKELFYKIEEIIENEAFKDSKSQFQEAAQEKFGVTPSYQVLDAWGADHDKTYKVGAFIGKDLFGEGEGSSKQKAEQKAAKIALDKVKTL